MAIEYKNANSSTAGVQLQKYFFRKEAIIKSREHLKYSILSAVQHMPATLPANSGKTIKAYVYYPLLDDKNINNQGIDANGVVKTGSGNLYGSSRDFNRIVGDLPANREFGGRINRVGFTRVDIESTLQEYGFFYEYTEDSIRFDSDAELLAHYEMLAMEAALQIYEDILLLDLLSRAGTVQYVGNATSDVTMNSGDTMVADTDAVIKYRDLVAAERALKANDVAKHTQVLAGTTTVDTRRIPSCWIAITDFEVVQVLKTLKDPHNQPLFIPVQQYADSVDKMVHPLEVGTVGQFRIVEDEKMIRWNGAGASVGSSTARLSQTNGKWDIHPFLIIGKEAFTTVSLFSKGGKNDKVITIHKKPGEAQASNQEVFGKLGFSSLRFWYGTLILRPERLHLLKTLA